MTKSRANQPSLPRIPSAQDLPRRIREAVLDAIFRHDPSQPPLRVTPAAVPTAPARLAAPLATESGQRASLTAAYELYLQAYRAAAERAGLGDYDDVGRAVAYFVAVNLQALHGTDPDADVLEPLERQLRLATRVCSDWDRASIAQRRFFFEQIAITGVLVATAWSRARTQGPDDIAVVQRAARGYLEQMLGLNPEALTLAPSGLVAHADVRVPAATPRAPANA
jgi:hypothetical protein